MGTLRRRWPEALALYLVAFAFCWRVGDHGIPWNAFEQIGWAAAILVALGFREPRRLLAGARDWGVFCALIVVYGIGMDRAHEWNTTVHYTAVTVDRATFGTDPVIWLQAHLWHGVGPLEYLTFFVYTSHFWAVLVVAAVMWRRGQFWRFARPWCVLTAAGTVIYLLFPAAPPWLAGQGGQMPHVTRITAITAYSLAGLPTAGWDGTTGETLGNPVAAVPSLHFAYPILIAAVLWQHRRLRPLLAAYPLAMGFSLVYLGEHFVFDLAAGGLLAAVVIALELRRAPQLDLGQEREVAPALLGGDAPVPVGRRGDGDAGAPVVVPT